MIFSSKMLKIKHNGGFFSCCSMRLDSIVSYFNMTRKVPLDVDSSKEFTKYKPNSSNKDITYEYFEKEGDDKVINYNNLVDYRHHHQYKNYKKLKYKDITPFINKYFSPTGNIRNIIKDIEAKYNLDYAKICVLFYRGNDKITETKLCSYDDIVNKALEISSRDPDIRFLIQSDETEFIELMKTKFLTNIVLEDEIRHMEKQNDTVDKVFSDLNYEFSKKYLAITVIMSKCKYIICGSGNCSIWIMLYRGNADNVYQNLNNIWVT